MKKRIVIDGKAIGEGCPAYIVAEMSANHLLDIERAKKIISAAKESGADAIKIQTYRPDTITIDCREPEFMATPGSLWEGSNLFELYGKAYTPWEWHRELFDYAKEIGITLFSSPFDWTAIDLLEELNVPAYKIASYEIVDIPLIRRVARTGKPVILSTGIADLTDISLAMNACYEEGNDNVILLKCVSEYPTPYQDLNLRTIPNMSETFDCIAGLSDHSMGFAVDVAGVSLGCKMIEKHMTLRRSDGGPDGAFSMEPEEFAEMVENVRNIEMALGKVTYGLTEQQKKGKRNSRSLYIVEDIKAGEKFTNENVRSIRPGYGVKPIHLDEIIGKNASIDLKKGTPMKWEFIQ